MKIIDTTAVFFEQYEKENTWTLNRLEQYYDQFPELFERYFQSHCQRTPERLQAALEHYPKQVETMRQVIARMPSILQEVGERMADYFGVAFAPEVYLLVGGFGSYAFVDHTHRVHFAVEQLTSDPDHLRVIVAHELTHAYHFSLLKQAQFDWSKLAWDGYTSLYLEGAATYVSQQVVPGLPEAVYYSFNETGADKIEFCHAHRQEILQAFAEDLAAWTFEQEKEWFRVRGGKRFGYHSLGYFLGREFFHALTEQMPVRERMTFWAERDLPKLVTEWLQLTNQTGNFRS